ncbi:MAG: hypothetical protein J6D06_03230 [Clostridia bacterium]|nr:hypothetical protein [Clostridia bacterium]
MIKKSLSLLLCIIMIFSCFSVVVPEVYAANGAKALFSVKGEPVAGNKIVYTISLTKDRKNVGGMIVHVAFDSNVLKPTSNSAPVEKTTAAEGTVYNLQGNYVYGVRENNPDLYSIAYMNTIAVSTTQATSFFKLEFEVVDPERPTTDIAFYCREYFSTTEVNENIYTSDVPQLIAEYKKVSTLAMPKLKSVEPHIDGLQFSWNPVEGALGYEIIRMAEGETWESLAAVEASSTAYVDSSLTSGKVYTYTVRAFNNYGYSLYDSIGVSCKYIEKPAIASLKNAVGGVDIAWNTTDGAEHYIVYRRAEGEAQWQQITKRGYSLGTNYKDTTVVDGVTYEYDVNSATDSFESALSPNGESITYISAPGISKVANVLSGIEITWSAHPQATHYTIYRKLRGIDAELLEYAEVTGTKFVDTNVAPGKSYTYSVKACTNKGESAYSPTGYTITCVLPTDVTSLSVEKNGIAVTWRAIENVDGYAIYRRPLNDNSWVKIATASKDTYTYTDTTVASGGEYIYAVCPYVSTSESVKIESAPIYYIKAPTGAAAENVIDGIKITWEPSNGAYCYDIFRVTDNGSYEKIADVNADDELSFVDTDVQWAQSYTYAVKAISIKGESLVGDSTVAVMRIGSMGIATPEITDGGIKVSWEAVDGATGYALYRSVDGVWSQLTTVEDAFYIDENVENEKAYAYAVAVVIGESRGILITDNAPSLTYAAPAKISGASNGSNYSKITWSAVDGAVSYEVYRKEAVDGAEYSLVASVGAQQLSFVDYNVQAGKAYIYNVKTVSSENTSAFSEGFRNTFLTIPQIKSIANAYGGITFTWGAVDGAEKYHVYRKIYGATYYTYITTVDADTLSFTDTGATNGKIMCYTVKAVSGQSTSAYLAKCMTYVKAPVVSYSNSASGVFLKWDKNDSAVGYWVYRKAGNAKSWTRIAVVTTPYYTDTKVTSGTNYTYTVKAYTGKILSACNMAGWTVKHLSVPELVAANNGYGAVTVSWKKVPGAAAYYVYRKANGVGSWSYIGKTTALSYRDTNVRNRNTYEYTVRAYYGTDTSYFKTKGVTAKFIEAPTLTVANRTGNVQLSWNAVTGATSYYIYRKAGNATSWTQIATVTSTSYVDKNVVNGTTYRYTIRSYVQKTLSGYNMYGWATVYLATPKLVSAVSANAGITVKWQSVKWATGYMIFRKTGNGAWVHIGTVNGTNTLAYLDRTAEYATKYTYTVRAYYGNYRSWYEPGLSCVDNY